jgi:hypothetical protein
MALLNIDLKFLAYLDATSSAQPKLKSADLAWSLQGMATTPAKNVPFALAPAETLSVVNSSRSLSFDTNTSFSIVKVDDTDYARLSGSFGARTARSAGDATTQWVITLSNTTARLTFSGTGTAPTFGGMSVGDQLTIEEESDFNELNWGDFTITKVGANYVEFTNATAAAETVTAAVAICSSGPVQVGDTLDLTSTRFVYANRGQFEIRRVTATYVEFTNASAVAESSITNVTTGLSIYTDLYKWLLLAADGRCSVRLNGDSGDTNEVEPVTTGSLITSPGLLLKRGKVYRIDVYNPGTEVVNGFLVLAE